MALVRGQRFCNTDASLMIILLLPHAAPVVQQRVLRRLLLLLDAHPANQRQLCQMNVLSILLRLYPQFHPGT